MFDVVEQLKKEWTDKFVVVSRPAPELARFANATGIVKTVNMNGRCLVEFDQFNNIGWYDIDPAFLKIVPKPLPKPPEAKPAKQPEAKKPAKQPEAKPTKQVAAKPAAAAGRPSTADILAAARAKGGGAAPAAAKPAAGKPSTADILAAARAKKAAAEQPPQDEEPAEETGAAAVSEVPPPKSSAPKKAAGGPLPTTTAERIAWCREHDAKS